MFEDLLNAGDLAECRLDDANRLGDDFECGGGEFGKGLLGIAGV